MNELFSKFELLRQELAKVASQINKATPDHTFGRECCGYLQDDIHRLRGRLMQIEPDAIGTKEKCDWQCVDGTVEVNIRTDRPM